MKKMTLKEIKRLVKLGAALDITAADISNIKSYEKIGYSVGVYGINGGLIRDNNGNLYAITARNSNLFRIF